MIDYNPKQSIARNAKRNGVTEDAIRKYILRNGIDRKADRLAQLVEQCQATYKANPELTPSQLAKATSHDPKTIKKHWDYITGKIGTELSQKIILREYNNYYATHPSVTEDLLRVEKFSHEVLEPFCGGGFMADVIEAHGHAVERYDIVDRGINKVADFTKLELPTGTYDVITNPPYDRHTIDHILKCIRICNSKVAMLLPLHYLTSKGRYNSLYKPFPPARIWVYQNRILFARNGDFDTYKDAGTDTKVYAWFVWERGYQGEPILKWILNENR